eukprot:120097-Rhodomonas_salina.1
MVRAGIVLWYGAMGYIREEEGGGRGLGRCGRGGASRCATSTCERQRQRQRDRETERQRQTPVHGISAEIERNRLCDRTVSVPTLHCTPVLHAAHSTIAP